MTTETFKDFYFSFPDEATAEAALQPFYHQPVTASVDEETGETVYTLSGDPFLVMNSLGHSFDIVGVIQRPTGSTIIDAQGAEYPEMAPIPGWHVNLRIRGQFMQDEAEFIDAFYGVDPVNPYRQWL